MTSAVRVEVPLVRNIVVNVHHCHLHIGLATPVGVSIVVLLWV